MKSNLKETHEIEIDEDWVQPNERSVTHYKQMRMIMIAAVGINLFAIVYSLFIYNIGFSFSGPILTAIGLVVFLQKFQPHNYTRLKLQNDSLLTEVQGDYNEILFEDVSSLKIVKNMFGNFWCDLITNDKKKIIFSSNFENYNNIIQALYHRKPSLFDKPIEEFLYT